MQPKLQKRRQRAVQPDKNTYNCRGFTGNFLSACWVSAPYSKGIRGDRSLVHAWAPTCIISIKSRKTNRRWIVHMAPALLSNLNNLQHSEGSGEWEKENKNNTSCCSLPHLCLPQQSKHYSTHSHFFISLLPCPTKQNRPPTTTIFFFFFLVFSPTKLYRKLGASSIPPPDAVETLGQVGHSGCLSFRAGCRASLSVIEGVLTPSPLKGD